MSNINGTMKAAQVSSAGGAFEIVERKIPDPGPDQVRIKVEACGVCHGDAAVKDGDMPEFDVEYPRIPGHEVAGTIDAVGADVTEWSTGQRVGVGWHGGHCFVCDTCRDGNFTNCEHKEITGITSDGGYAEYMVASHETLAAIPDGINPVTAGPLVCAGLTSYNALRRSIAQPGDLVAVQGIGGVGHTGIQFSRKMGFETVAVSRGTEKKALAHEMGAHHYIDSNATDPAVELSDLGGADVILATAPNSDAIEAVTGGLSPHGQLLVVAVPHHQLEVELAEFVNGRRSIQGWNCGHAYHTEETLEFSSMFAVEPMVDTYPLEEVDTAYERMMSGNTRLKAVIKPPHNL